MRSSPRLSLAAVGPAGLLTACGATIEQKAATGAVARPVVAGPVAAAAGQARKPD